MRNIFKITSGIFIITNFVLIYSCQSPKDLVQSPQVVQTTNPTTSNTIVENTTEIKEINQLITQKCTYCHSTTPNSASGYNTAPKSISFDSTQEINNSITKIKKVVADGSMPLGNITLSDNEKLLVKNWEIKKVVTPKTNPVSILNIKQLVTQKCTYCHSIKPNIASGYTKSPKNMLFDSDKDINDNIDLIKKVVSNGSMPLGNISLSTSEKDLIQKWIIASPPIQTPVNVIPAVLNTNNPINQLVTQKCSYCHSATPNSASGYTKAPRGIIFDSDKDINDNITKIKTVVADKSMPTGNITLSSAEMDSIQKWVLPNQASGNTTQNTLVVKSATDIITQKCAYCHSSKPDESSGYKTAPKKLTFDSLQEMSDKHDDISKVVLNKEMPINNITMTNLERSKVIAWCDEQELEEKKKPFWSRLIGEFKF